MAMFLETDDNGPVDGFSDTEGQTHTGEPDPGRGRNAPPPLSPEEYARLQKEAREAPEDKA